jgi:hypothetical protein
MSLKAQLEIAIPAQPHALRPPRALPSSGAGAPPAPTCATRRHDACRREGLPEAARPSGWPRGVGCRRLMLTPTDQPSVQGFDPPPLRGVAMKDEALRRLVRFLAHRCPTVILEYNLLPENCTLSMNSAIRGRSGKSGLNCLHTAIGDQRLAVLALAHLPQYARLYQLPHIPLRAMIGHPPSRLGEGNRQDGQLTEVVHQLQEMRGPPGWSGQLPPCLG